MKMKTANHRLKNGKQKQINLNALPDEKIRNEESFFFISERVIFTFFLFE